MKKLILVILSLFICLPCFALTKTCDTSSEQAFNRTVTGVRYEIQYKLGRHEGGTDITKELNKMHSFLISHKWNSTSQPAYKINEYYMTLTLQIINDFEILHKTKSNPIIMTHLLNVKKIRTQEKEVLERYLTSELYYIYSNKVDWIGEDKALSSVIEKLIAIDPNYSWIRLRVILLALSVKNTQTNIEIPTYIPGMPTTTQTKKQTGYDCTQIPQNSMPSYMQHVVECRLSPLAQGKQFTQLLQYDYIWKQYDKIIPSYDVNSDWSKYIKQQVYLCWLYGTTGDLFYNNNSQNWYPLLVAVPTLEKQMNNLYGYFPKLSHKNQMEYINAFTSLGQQCIKEGKFTTQIQRDVYICHCLYLLKFTTDRQAFYKLNLHIRNVSKVMIQEGSIYQIPMIIKYLKEQTNIKEASW